jgi:hypothetical protein
MLSPPSLWYFDSYLSWWVILRLFIVFNMMYFL